MQVMRQSYRQGLVISLVVVFILLYTEWRGWEMVYRNRVAVSDERK
jgi:hypothetical protein